MFKQSRVLADGLLPPWSQTGTEVGLGPWREGHHIVNHVAVSQSQGQRSWSTNHLTLEVVLTSMAWAHELIFSSVPWNDASQMGAHGIQSILLYLSFSSHNEIGGISLETLGQAPVSWLMGLDPHRFLQYNVNEYF